MQRVSNLRGQAEWDGDYTRGAVRADAALWEPEAAVQDAPPAAETWTEEPVHLAPGSELHAAPPTN